MPPNTARSSARSSGTELAIATKSLTSAKRSIPLRRPSSRASTSQGRLVAHDGRCVDGARLVKCGGAKSQKWKLQDNKRLTNQNKQCLQVASHPPKGETKVTAAACNKKAAAQVWN